MTRLSDSEIYVMHMIWNIGQGTTSEIVEESKNDGRLTENTVKTLIRRMAKKGAINVVGKVEKEYIYKPAIDKKKYLKQEADRFVNVVFSGNAKGMFESYIEDKTLTKQNILNVLKILEEREKQKNKEK